MPRLSTVAAVLSCGVAAAVVCPAAAFGVGDDDPKAPKTGGEGHSVVVKVSGTGVKKGNGGKAGQSGSSTVTVFSPCSMNALDTGKDYYEWVSSGAAYRDWHNQTGGNEGVFKPKAGYLAHKDDDKGHWYGGSCTSTGFENLKDFFAYSTKWFAEHGDLYVEYGEQPPTPPVPPEVLLEAATKAMTLPEPTIDWNPKRNGDAATLVNFDTWVWLTDQEPALYVDATAGDTTVRVDAIMDSMTVSAPDAGSALCKGGGVPYASGASSDCTIAFTRSSQAGGTTPVTTTTLWLATWSVTMAGVIEDKGPIPDPLAPISNVTDIAVREVHALATS